MNNPLLLRLLLASFLLLHGASSQVCEVCRPRVQAGIHDAAYAAHLLLVLLPVGLLLLGAGRADAGRFAGGR